MSDGCSDGKWSCSFCTYENFPAAKKCTMCFKGKSSDIISDTINEEQDIYKIAPLLRSPAPQESNTLSGSSSGSSTQILNINSSESGKWCCEFCTYLNWPKSPKCVQCLNTRKKPSPTASRSNERLSSLKINVKTNDNLPGGATTLSSLSPNSLLNHSLVNESNNDINRIGNAKQTFSPGKWICAACTYENWPRSGKCILCKSPRPRASNEGQVCSASRSLEATSLRRSPTGSSTPRSDRVDSSIMQASASASSLASYPASPPMAREKRLMMLRSQLRDTDWLWLNACTGVVDGDLDAIHAFIGSGGHPSRQLTLTEVELLNRPSAFQAGYTLVHLAIRFQREDMLAILLAATDVTSKTTKRLPCMACPDLATDIRRQIVSFLRQRKGDFPCSYVAECVTFSLPADIEDLDRNVQDQLFDEILDRDVQSELEEEAIINWSVEVTERLGSRLYALWNRTAGDCLLDSVLQATWGVFDLDNSLRRAMADSLRAGAMTFYPRWKEYESLQAESLHFSLDENQWQRDWAVLLTLASQPGTALEQTHIFALSHILRRPIIVYGVKYVKSFRGETIGFAKFQGVYLPLLWESSFCFKNPVALGYTRGHFSALVPIEIDLDDGLGAGANIDPSDDEDQVNYLPLVDCEGKLLQLHFLAGSEIGREESVLKEWLNCHMTKGGLLVAKQRLDKRPVAVKQMVDEWLDSYRQLQARPTSLSIKSHFSSDGESDDE